MKRLTVRADEVKVGDRLVGRKGRPSYAVRFVVGRIAGFNRDGERLGPRFHAVNPNEVHSLDALAETLFIIEREDPQ